MPLLVNKISEVLDLETAHLIFISWCCQLEATLGTWSYVTPSLFKYCMESSSVLLFHNRSPLHPIHPRSRVTLHGAWLIYLAMLTL